MSFSEGMVMPFDSGNALGRTVVTGGRASCLKYALAEGLHGCIAAQSGDGNIAITQCARRGTK